MFEMTDRDLSGVSETALITLYLRVVESRRPDALIKDEKAEAVVRQMDEERLRKTLALTEDSGRVVMILKTRDFDRITQDFLARSSASSPGSSEGRGLTASQPDAVVLHIGCGLDTRFERVAEHNSRVEWYDLDLPDVIELRRKLIGGEGPRHHFLACSVFDSDWLSAMEAHRGRPVLFLAEGVFMYFDEAQVRSLVLTMKQHFPGAELAFDAYSVFMRWAHNLRVARKRVGSPLRWALKRPQDVERWGDGIRLLDERFPFQYPEPRLRRAAKVRLVPLVGRGIGVYHYQLQGE